MPNFFRRGLCSLLAVGFIFFGHNSLNRYETDLSLVEKPANIQKESPPKLAPMETIVQLTQLSYGPTIKSSIGIDKSNLCLIKSSSLDENAMLNYKNLFMPESNYLIREEENKFAREHARYQLLKSLGLKNPLFYGELYSNSVFDANLHIDLMKLDDLVNPSRDNKSILDSFDLMINIRF